MSMKSKLKREVKKIRIRTVKGKTICRDPNNYLCWSSCRNNQNFGDILSPYLYEKITGHKPQFKTPHNNDKDGVYVAVGSIMSKVMCNCIVWGTGIIDRTDLFYRPQRICAVRGPLTRERCLELGYDCPEIYGDPALLLPQYYNPVVAKKHKVGIVPHYVDQNLVRTKYPNDCDVQLIDLLEDVECVVDEILSCEMVISSSLHGCIVAHAYGIPAAWVQFSHDVGGDGSKFYDYYASVGVRSIQPCDLTGDVVNYNTIMTMIGSAPKPQEDLVLIADKLLACCPYISSL